ncbi:hypothetical protein PsorP6_011646 [Peronosclerospora sorghi]|uniref:Uncharacterized protein n=1 Tax=Peronosclerospora sorghi TaxID=230839 RepID=A0ACC0WJE0_9STRA|nr:hypothetical protein PsorP6_011646 [Peronosclerospora sorghi]
MTRPYEIDYLWNAKKALSSSFTSEATNYQLRNIDCINSTFPSKRANDTQSSLLNMPSIVCPIILNVSPSSEEPEAACNLGSFIGAEVLIKGIGITKKCFDVCHALITVLPNTVDVHEMRLDSGRLQLCCQHVKFKVFRDQWGPAIMLSVFSNVGRIISAQSSMFKSRNDSAASNIGGLIISGEST